MIASVQPSRDAASNSSAWRRVAGALRLRALRRGLPTEDIGRAYGTAMCKSSRAGRIATGIATGRLTVRWHRGPAIPLASAAKAGHSQRFLSAPSCAPRDRLDETRAGRSARRANVPPGRFAYERCRPAIACSGVDRGLTPSAVPSSSNFPASHSGLKHCLVARSYWA